MKKKNKINKVLTSLILCFCLSQNSLIAQNLNKEPIMKQGPQLVQEINGIREFYLSNGLKVLLKENHSIPLITFSVWYKAGSRNEPKGQRGLAHFLEHMMFKGTKKYKKGEISETIQNLGGVYNAFTSSDCTAYYETIAPEYLEKVIDIESDRMQNSILNEKELNLEKTVVLSEYEGDLNNPATLLDYKIRELAYEVSPYKYPTIGTEGDIKAIDRKIMYNFYREYYSPKNAVVVLAGNFNEKSALDLINQYFSGISNLTNGTSGIILKERLHNKQKRITVRRTGSFKIVEIVYHTTNAEDKDIYALNIIEEYLIKGEQSPLRKKLIETGLATEIFGGAETNKDPGLFQILVSLTPQATHKQVESIITKEIDNLKTNKITTGSLRGAKNRIKANYLYNLDGTFSTVLNIGFFEAINSWEQSQEWISNIEKVTQDDVVNAAKKYLNVKNSTVGYFKPILPKGIKYQAIPLSLPKSHSYRQTQINNQEQKNQSLPTTEKFTYKDYTLKDNSKLFIYDKIDLPITFVFGVIKGGSSILSKELEDYCPLIARTLEKGSKKYSKEDIKNILDQTGSTLEFSCDEESFRFALSTTNETIEPSLNLLLDTLINPVFPVKEIEKEKKKNIAELNELKESTNEIAQRQLSQLIYPKEHPYYSNTIDEEIKNLTQLNPESLKKIHKTLVKDKTVIISAVTNIKGDKLNYFIETLNKYLAQDSKKAEGTAVIPVVPISKAPQVKTTIIKDKLQSDVFLGHAGKLHRTDEDFYKINIANYILGGSSLSSRLSKKVRDASGLVYTIVSYLNATYGAGEFSIYFGSNNNNVDKAVALIKEEISNFVKNGITEEELNKAKFSLVSSFTARNLSTYKKIGATIANIEYFNLGSDYIDSYLKIINSLQLKEVNEAIKRHISPKQLNISIAGEYKKG